jgi:hypothetical protein
MMMVVMATVITPSFCLEQCFSTLAVPQNLLGSLKNTGIKTLYLQPIILFWNSKDGALTLVFFISFSEYSQPGLRTSSVLRSL